MGLRKRFLVVVVGVPGSPAEAQRSEIGRFRNTGTARQAGSDEWRRILFVHAAHVDRYRIVIEDDGVEVGDVPMPELPADAAPGILDETVTPLGMNRGALGEPLVPEPDVIDTTGQLAVVGDEHDDVAATGEHVGMVGEVTADDGPATASAPAGDDGRATLAERPYVVIEEPPEGPVPDEIIQRFAEMVAAEEERAAERSTRDAG